MYLFDVYILSNMRIAVEVKKTIAFFSTNDLFNIMLHWISFQETDMRMLWNAKSLRLISTRHSHLYVSSAKNLRIALN